MIGVILNLVQDEARRMWCYRWVALLTTLALFAGATAYLLQLPRAYEAWGQLYVSKQTPLAAAANGMSLVGDGYGSAYVVQRTLLNEENLEDLLRQTNPQTARLGAAARAAAVAELRSRIRVVPDSGDGFIEFHVTDSDPTRASRTAALLLQQFIARNVRRSRDDLLRAEGFLDEQIAAEAAQLAAAQRRLVALQPRTVRTSTSSASPQAAAPLTAPRPSAAAERVSALETRLASLRGLYTDAYPDVVATRRQLAEAQAERAAEPETPALAAPSHPRLAELRPRIVATLSPAASMELAEAQRTAEVLRLNYQQLVAKREGARMALAVYGSDAAGKFQVTRRPVTPTTPNGGKRWIYVALAGAASVGAGLLAAYLRGATRGILVSPRELELVCQLPVVGAVTWEPAWATGRRRRPRRVRRSQPAMVQT